MTELYLFKLTSAIVIYQSGKMVSRDRKMLIMLTDIPTQENKLLHSAETAVCIT